MVLAFLVGLVIGAWCRLKGWVWLLATGAGYKGCKLPLSGSWIILLGFVQRRTSPKRPFADGGLLGPVLDPGSLEAT